MVHPYFQQRSQNPMWHNPIQVNSKMKNSIFTSGKIRHYIINYKRHNQFQNIPHYILGSDPQKWAKLGEKNVQTYIKYPFYSI